MKTTQAGTGLVLVLTFSVARALPAQDQPAQPPAQPQEQQQQPPPPTLSRPSDQPRPTLGEGPASGGPHSPNTSDKRKLLEVQSIYVETMDNGLAEKLIEAIGTNGPFRIVANAHDADAVLRGTCFDSVRLKTVHSEVFLAARDGSSIWQDAVRQPYRPPPLAQAVSATAQTISEDLQASIREAHEK